MIRSTKKDYSENSLLKEFIREFIEYDHPSRCTRAGFYQDTTFSFLVPQYPRFYHPRPQYPVKTTDAAYSGFTDLFDWLYKNTPSFSLNHSEMILESCASNNIQMLYHILSKLKDKRNVFTLKNLNMYLYWSCRYKALSIIDFIVSIAKGTELNWSNALSASIIGEDEKMINYCFLQGVQKINCDILFHTPNIEIFKFVYNIARENYVIDLLEYLLSNILGLDRRIIAYMKKFPIKKIPIETFIKSAVEKGLLRIELVALLSYYYEDEYHRINLNKYYNRGAYVYSPLDRSIWDIETYSATLIPFPSRLPLDNLIIDVTIMERPSSI